jgi:DNA helicase-2/ATP-dependent DNA helicase PcrA
LATEEERDAWEEPPMTDWKSLLNDRQYEAVTHGEGPLLILAGAGSGKTRVLTCRLSHLIESGVPAERILQLTFTNKAADEMKTRAIEMSDERCSGVMACTYHSFCSKMLHEYGSVVGLPRNATILNIPDARSVINIVKFQLFQDFPKGYPNEMSLANIFSSAMNKQIGIDKVLSTDPRLKRYACYLDSIEAIGRAYARYKRDHDMVDYDDLIAMFKLLLAEHEDIRSEIEGRYDYIMVDEYQDTNPMQDDIVFMLRKSNPNRRRSGKSGGSHSPSSAAFTPARPSDRLLPSRAPMAGH